MQTAAETASSAEEKTGCISNAYVRYNGMIQNQKLNKPSGGKYVLQI